MWNWFKKKEKKDRCKTGTEIIFSLRDEFDSYQEWLEDMNKNNGLSESTKYKECLESIFQRRDEITIEELNEYIPFFTNRRKVFAHLIAFYQDLYKNSNEYNSSLIEKTIKDLDLNKKVLDWAREIIKYEEVKKEFE